MTVARFALGLDDARDEHGIVPLNESHRCIVIGDRVRCIAVGLGRVRASSETIATFICVSPQGIAWLVYDAPLSNRRERMLACIERVESMFLTDDDGQQQARLERAKELLR